jgi:hypothetical protein
VEPAGQPGTVNLDDGNANMFAIEAGEQRQR